MTIGPIINAGVWRHYKGGRYLVLGLARHTETDEQLVVYCPLYEHPDGGKALQCRPLKDWNTPVRITESDSGDSRSVRMVLRFEYEGELRPKDGPPPRKHKAAKFAQDKYPPWHQHSSKVCKP
jgi:hypothetical protein